MRIPLEIEYVKGIMMMHMKAGIASVKSSKGILVTGSSIIRPTRISTGAIAPAGMLISLKIAGLMARIYDIVRNVVMPAIISVRTVVLLGSKPNSFLSVV